MTPGTFGPYVLAALPYAGAEALRILAWCIAFTVPAAAAVWLLAGARRLAGPSTPGIRHLFRVTGEVDAAHLPVRRPQCPRCTSGDNNLPCGCDTDCYAAVCLGWLDDETRMALRGER